MAYFLLPSNQHYHLNIVKDFVLPLVEIGVIFFIVYSAYKTVQEFKKAEYSNYDFLLQLKSSATQVLGYPKIANVLSTEIAMVYYGLISWSTSSTENKTFTYYKENGIIALFSVIMFLLIAETSIVHLLLARWNATIAWVVFGLSVYTALQLFAHIKAIVQRPIVLRPDKLFVKYGLFGDITINLEVIDKVEPTSQDVTIEGKKVEKIGLLGDIENHNVAIHLKQPQILEKAYGITKSVDVLLLHIDDVQEFVKNIEREF